MYFIYLSQTDLTYPAVLWYIIYIEYAIDLFADAQKKVKNNVSVKIEKYRDEGLNFAADLNIMIDTVHEKMKKFTDKLLKMTYIEIEKVYNDKMNGELAFGIETLK